MGGRNWIRSSFIYSLNITRRHSTAEQRREAAARLLKTTRGKRSSIAKQFKLMTRSSPQFGTTWCKVRKFRMLPSTDLSNGLGPRSKTTRSLASKLAEVAGVSPGTAKAARSAPIKPPKPAPEPAQELPVTKEQRLDVLLEPFCEELPVTKQQIRRGIALCCIIARRRAGLTHKEIIDIVDPLRAA